jgi:hypothetical protein
MPLAEDQQQVGDLDPPGERKPFRVSIHTAAAEFHDPLARAASGMWPGARPRWTGPGAGRYSVPVGLEYAIGQMTCGF